MENEKLQRLGVVMERSGLPRSTIYYLIEKDMFPKQVKLGKRTVAWRKSEIDAWIENREYSMSKGQEQSIDKKGGKTNDEK